jgi:hypothetical protein
MSRVAAESALVDAVAEAHAQREFDTRLVTYRALAP